MSPTQTARKRRSTVAVGALVAKVAGPAFAAQGFPSSALVSEWAAIAGSEFASFSAPERLVWPRGAERRAEDQAQLRDAKTRQGGATLVLRVEGPRALEIQHAAPQLLERINAYFGYRAVAQLRMVQAPLSRRKRPPARAPSAEPLDEADPRLSGIEDPDLRGALAKLAARVDPEAN